jgi:hypothetical protein
MTEELRLHRIEEKMGEVSITLTKNTTLLEINTAILDDHIKRTEILEKEVSGLAMEARLLRWGAAASAAAIAILQLVQYLKV